jgi:hypothetical protein
MAVRHLEVDDGWVLERDSGRSTDRHLVDLPRARIPRRNPYALVALLREALTLLDGREPLEIRLSGDGWSLV